ncbi:MULTISPECIES: DNA/RNA nuclease SfsA [Ensifer]|uniref:Sugar fermentation stimulation protein homolog n=1 Tax=Ensifer canadensis TaxID=555315 RepID=A0AAW4FE46_9HYPH|nr:MULTISPECIES: DNA/RNA nuclease SfsA [Ensifer]MDP9630009.1 sugar fermentation stimulation protein A [Ensifer adhaerens]KQU96845.1 XRE family transcriptional regulator [Ensifer sp. Root31]KQW60831.1 XRE family transcriptional regulator [Ensifer sp. Root1252]KQW75373.1 XRE family transcriptional regulator [Ensifer sp. Root127]KQY66928.1 XRE family transcriptional regulator [Ensifer sp. Root142]
MIFDRPLVPATLVQRYKRFLFDALLADGTALTGSCPNTGSMRGLTTPGSRIWMSEHDSPTRKYRQMLEIVEADGTLVGINTGLPNRLAEEAIRLGLVADLHLYENLAREQKYGRNSRIDILLSDSLRGLAYVEVKNVHFSRNPGVAEFPDSPTARGAKHLEELGDMVEAGHRAIMVYLVQRSDCDHLQICRDYDPVYAAAFDRAMTRGVEAYAVKCLVSPSEIAPIGLIAIDEAGASAIRNFA